MQQRQRKAVNNHAWWINGAIQKKQMPKRSPCAKQKSGFLQSKRRKNEQPKQNEAVDRGNAAIRFLQTEDVHTMA
ncbi:hypothetical protein P9743_06385 [Anoxybacillus geothermalis]|nr:hypothetical protein [Anoxybacillus geothermalis]